jgi:phosphate transport system permease protein
MGTSVATATDAGPRRDMTASRALGARRRRKDVLVRALCLVATAIGLLFLASILFTLFWRGLGGLSLEVFTVETKPPGSGGGLLNAIVGTLIQTAIGTLIGAPVGLLVGTYLAEYARASALGNAVRFVSDVLLSAPSILIGLFIYQVAVLPFGGFSGLAGALALAVIVVPVVVRTTEDMLRLIPDTLREAVIALGAPKWKMVTLVCYRAALSGILTGVLLAVARIAGETAPLLFTSLGNLNWSVALNQPMASLPVTIYQYAGSPFNDWVELAWVAALIVTLGVLILNIVARVALRARD